MAGLVATTKSQQMPGTMNMRKLGNDLIQNCDLPPPIKVFLNSDDATIMNDMITKNTRSVKQDEIDVGDNQMGVMKALRLSQTRAREAEAKCGAIAKEHDSLLLAFMEDSIKIFGYKYVVRSLEFQASQLRQQKAQRHGCECRSSQSNGVNWMTAWALWLGVAGFGFGFGFGFGLVVGSKYYHFPTFK